MKVFRGKTIVITGAAAGIGRYLALNFAREGAHLAISDINPEGLQETVDMMGQGVGRITTHLVDVADRKQVFQMADKVMADYGRVDVVVNNAGTAMAGTLEELSMEEFEWLMNINFWGVVYGSMAFLPYLRQQSEANLVNLSSVHGLFTNPGVGAYCTSKFAVRGFTQTLCQELKDSSVSVSCVHPGGIRTNIVRNSRIPEKVVPEQTLEEAQEEFDTNIARISADEAARRIIKGVRKNKPRILVGGDAHIYDFVARLFPVGWQKLMARLPEMSDKSMPETV